MSDSSTSNGQGGGGKPGLPPSLPVIPLEPWEQRSNLEKYGGFFYLAVGGLALMLGMILWFAWGVWSTREVWRDVYILHDPSRPEAERIGAADRLARNPDATDRQRYDIALKRDLPGPARYLLAESLSAEAASGDPRAFALAVARSEGWPGWLRLLMLRPLALGAGDGEAVAQDPLRELADHDDPVIRLWALYTLAESSRYNTNDEQGLRTAAVDGPHPDLASILVRALDADSREDRLALLDRATQWIRVHHPNSRRVWDGWSRVEGGSFVKES